MEYYSTSVRDHINEYHNQLMKLWTTMGHGSLNLPNLMTHCLLGKYENS